MLLIQNQVPYAGKVCNLIIKADSIHDIFIYVAPKRTTQAQKSNTNGSAPKTLNNVTDLLTRRRCFYCNIYLQGLTLDLWISETKRKQYDITPISTSMASSGILNGIETTQGMLKNYIGFGLHIISYTSRSFTENPKGY
jgi:hypothetical protein